MKKFITAIALVFSTLAGAAHAEVDMHRIHAHKYWAVDFVTSDIGDWCSAASHKNDGTSVAISSKGEGVDIQIYTPSQRWKRSTGSFGFQIDKRTAWRTENAIYDNNSIFVDNVKWDVVKQLANGNALHLYNWRGEYVESFSLAGSKSALIALGNCVSKLSNTSSARY